MTGPGIPDSTAAVSRSASRTNSLTACMLRIAAIVLVAAITLGVVAIRQHLADFEALGYVGAFFAMLLSNATLILPAPGLIVVFALGSTFNPLLLGVAGALGATLGEITGYLTGYSGLGVMEHSRISARINRWMARSGTLTIFVLAIIPNPFFDVAGLIAGAGRMPVLRFFGATFCGKTIQSTLIALAGLMSLEWVERLLTH